MAIEAIGFLLDSSIVIGGSEMAYYSTSFLLAEGSLSQLEMKNFTIKISNSIRAMMECLYLVPGKMDLVTCYELMEGLNDLQPDKVQMLLEQRSIVKIKRLFLFLAEKAGH